MQKGTISRVEDRLSDFTRDPRMLVLSCMALVVGAISAVVAYALVWLIAVITNVAWDSTSSMVLQQRLCTKVLLGDGTGTFNLVDPGPINRLGLLVIRNCRRWTRQQSAVFGEFHCQADCP